MEPKQPQSNSFLASDVSDEALFVALKNGDAVALSILFQRHGRLVYGLALKILANSQEAEDLTQEIFLTLLRNSLYQKNLIVYTDFSLNWRISLILSPMIVFASGQLYH
jgi:Sigma-70 region 2